MKGVTFTDVELIVITGRSKFKLAWHYYLRLLVW